MKKCPFCKAEIEENAVFCLYCMNQLEEKSIVTSKKKSKRIIISGVCVISILLGSILLFLISERSEENEPSSPSYTESIEEIPEANGYNSEYENDNFENSESTSQADEEIKYKYRDSVYGDEVNGYGISADYIENGITIIGVETASESGVYVIPETIDGKKVIAIDSKAFCEEHIKDTVKIVFVPKTVVGIKNYAFSDCCNMTDLYIQGESVAGVPDLFFPTFAKANNTITLHSSETCNDREHRTFKGQYSYNYSLNHGEGLVWKFEEWDGLL